MNHKIVRRIKGFNVISDYKLIQVGAGEITNKMQPCNRIYYFTVH
jgi:hypothetical protein